MRAARVKFTVGRLEQEEGFVEIQGPGNLARLRISSRPAPTVRSVVLGCIDPPADDLQIVTDMLRGLVHEALSTLNLPPKDDRGYEVCAWDTVLLKTAFNASVLSGQLVPILPSGYALRLYLHPRNADTYDQRSITIDVAEPRKARLDLQNALSELVR